MDSMPQETDIEPTDKDAKPGTDIYLITGSSGFLGRALAHRFGSKNNTIVGFDMDGPPYPPPNTECLFCDLTSDESVQKTFQMVRMKNGSKIKAVFHLAAYYSFSGEESKLYDKLTVQGTERVLRELQNFEVGQFIFSSSMLLNKPNQPGEKIDENSPVEATWQYPQSKVDAEKVLHEKHGNIPVVSLRIAGVYDDDCHSIPISHQIQRIYEKTLEGHLYSGDTDVRQSFVHIDDLVDAFQACVDREAQLPIESTFVIGEPEAMSYEEMQKQIGMTLHGEDWKTISVPKPIAKVGAFIETEIPIGGKPFIRPWMIDRADDNYELNIDKAHRELGWQPKHSLRTSLPIMLEKLKADPPKFYKDNKLKAPGWLKDKDKKGEIAPPSNQGAKSLAKG